MTQSFALDHRVNPYVILSTGATSNGTATAQLIGGTYSSNYARHINPDNVDGWFAEPREASQAPGAMQTIDSMTRIVAWCERGGADTNAWLYSLSIGRGTSGGQATVIIPAGIVERRASWIAGQSIPLVLDGAFPHDFLSHPSTDNPQLTDTVNFQLTVTPGTATAEDIMFFAIMCRPPQGSSSNRGNAVGLRVR